MSGYREQGRDLDHTEIERAKIHEDAETKRRAIEAREETRRLALSQRGTAPYVILCCLLAGSIVTCIEIIARTYREATHPGEGVCLERAVPINYSSDEVVCTHSLHVLVVTQRERICRCATKTVAEAGAP